MRKKETEQFEKAVSSLESLLKEIPKKHSRRNYAEPSKLRSANLLELAPNPPKRTYSKISSALLSMLILLAGAFFFYNFADLTGLVVYTDNAINLDVNSNISKEALVFLNVNLKEHSKSINEFNLELIDDSYYYIGQLEVDITKFDLNLSSGQYEFTLSLVDNGQLKAISSKEILITEEVVTEPLPEVTLKPIVEPLPEVIPTPTPIGENESSAIQADTCTYTGIGEWNVNCYDNCTINSLQNVNNNNVNLNGAGTFTVHADIINVNSVNLIGQSPNNKCVLSLRGGNII